MSKLCDLLDEIIELSPLRENPVILMGPIPYGIQARAKEAQVTVYLTVHTKKILRYHIVNGVKTLKSIQYL